MISNHPKSPVVTQPQSLCQSVACSHFVSFFVACMPDTDDENPLFGFAALAVHCFGFDMPAQPYRFPAAFPRMLLAWVLLAAAADPLHAYRVFRSVWEV